MNPRLYGPFPSRRQRLLFLDDALDKLCDVSAEIDVARSKRMVKEECQATVYSPIIEHPILNSQNPTRKKGVNRCA